MSNEDRLINACMRGDYQEVKSTVESLEVKINYQDDNGKTPLMWASINGHLNVVQYLIEEGANPNIKNNKGKTALDLAEENGHKKVAEFLRKARAKHGNEID